MGVWVMGTALMLEPHAEASAVFEAYRGERDAVRRSHLQVIWLLLAGETPATVSRVSGFGARWIAKLVGRWNAEGFDGLGDRRRDNCGAAPLLDTAGLAASAAAPLGKGTPAEFIAELEYHVIRSGSA